MTEKELETQKLYSKFTEKTISLAVDVNNNSNQNVKSQFNSKTSTISSSSTDTSRQNSIKDSKTFQKKKPRPKGIVLEENLHESSNSISFLNSNNNSNIGTQNRFNTSYNDLKMSLGQQNILSRDGGNSNMHSNMGN